jgi:glutamate racemase
MDARPIGFFDSGVGGLSVLREVQRLAPSEDLLYFADTLWFPYGGRPGPEVRKRSFAITQRLLQSDVKLIVVACNTASAAAIDDLRQAWDSVPFVGMVPGLKPAASSSKSGSVAILATPGTLGGELYARVSSEFGRGVRVTEVAGHGLAEAVERGEANTPETRARLHELLDGPVNHGVDTVVLGCTHYAFLRETLSDEFPGLNLVDTSEPVARRAIQVLNEGNALAPGESSGSLDIIVSGDVQAFRLRMAQLGFAPAQGVTA